MVMQNILKLSQMFLKHAVSQSMLALRRPMDRKYLGSNNWFGQNMNPEAPYLDMDNFEIAKFDKENIQSIKKIIDNGFLDGNPKEIYLENLKTNEFIDFLISSYNKYFGKRFDANNVVNNLVDEMEQFETPLWVIIHDLIHQVLEPKFVKNLSTRYEYEETTVLADEIYEDLASSLSNFQPSGLNEFGRKRQSFLVQYIETIFNQNFDKSYDAESLKFAIEKTFHILKAELRNKIETISDEISENHLEKFKSTQVASAKIKQLVDGMLSKFKFEMIQQIPGIIWKYENKQIGPNKEYMNVFEAFELEDIQDEYQTKILESDVIEQSDSSSLRTWMIEVLQAIKKLNHYFKYEFEQEIIDDYPPPSE